MTDLGTHPPKNTRIFRGTIEEVLKHRDEIPAKAQVELRILQEKPEQKTESVELSAKPKQRVSAMGKYAHVPGGSEVFALEKQAEIDREDRPRS